MISLNLVGIEDQKVRVALEAIQAEINSQAILGAGLKLYEVELDGAVTNHAISHNLGYVPTDIIVVSNTGSSYTFKWDMFTNEQIFITTTGAASIRFLMGRSTQGATLT